MSQRVVYFNGRFVPESEARVSIFDSALMYGDIAFEMTRTYNHRPFKLRELLDLDGFLSEGPGWNIFLVKNGELLTPSRATSCWASAARRRSNWPASWSSRCAKQISAAGKSLGSACPKFSNLNLRVAFPLQSKAKTVEQYLIKSKSNRLHCTVVIGHRLKGV